MQKSKNAKLKNYKNLIKKNNMSIPSHTTEKKWKYVPEIKAAEWRML
jgi:hypothetical protein